MPLNFRGRIVDDFTLTLKDGKVVDYTAGVGLDVLKSILETDAGSCYFGEMALIDVTSPIASLGAIFYTTLYDENASCHIALGMGLAGDKRSVEEKDAGGINSSILHVDFMVGSDDMNITGLTETGEWEDVFTNGKWAIKI
jgi:aminopeptidase